MSTGGPVTSIPGGPGRIRFASLSRALEYGLVGQRSADRAVEDLLHFILAESVREVGEHRGQFSPAQLNGSSEGAFHEEW